MSCMWSINLILPSKKLLVVLNYIIEIVKQQTFSSKRLMFLHAIGEMRGKHKFITRGKQIHELRESLLPFFFSNRRNMKHSIKVNIFLNIILNIINIFLFNLSHRVVTSRYGFNCHVLQRELYHYDRMAIAQ